MTSPLMGSEMAPASMKVFNQDLDLALAQFKHSRPIYEEAYEMYKGTCPEIFASAKIRAILAESGKYFKLNVAAGVVDAVNDCLEVKSISTGVEDIDTAIEDLLEYNQADLEFGHQNLYTLVYGESYQKIWAGDIDETTGEILSVDLMYFSPMNVQAVYAEDNPREISFVAQMWEIRQGKDKKIRVELQYPDRIEQWISEGDHPTCYKDFVPYFEYRYQSGEDSFVDTHTAENPYGILTWTHFRTDGSVGAPEHERAYGPQNAINKITATMMASVDWQGFPQRYAITVPGGGQQDDEDIDFPAGPNGEVVRHVGGSSRGGPGTMMWFTETKEVGTFQPASPEGFLASLQFFIEAAGAVTKTPVSELYGAGSIPSGESLRVKRAPLLKKVRRRQLSFGSAYSNSVRVALIILGFDPNEIPKIKVQWADAASNSDKEFWDTVKSKTDAGVPVSVALAEAGYSAEVIASWGITEPELDALTSSIQKLYAAVTAGLLSREEARALLPERAKTLLRDQLGTF